MLSRVKNSSGNYAEAQAELNQLFSVGLNEAKLIKMFNSKLDDASKIDYQKIAGTLDPVISSMTRSSSVISPTPESDELLRLRKENLQLREEILNLREKLQKQSISNLRANSLIGKKETELDPSDKIKNYDIPSLSK
ncbi:MAG TPA: hypothetical protein VL360_07250 [Gammaproteobacteria bacterium]|nr:hypothetical protein [Gammaproteobacteria bacterium]